MSRLRELRLQGFKTFADPTRFVFEPGVNAVIGPNGSGKSNMADAVRWVLGEQSNRSLRTRKADDVIFGGSQQRRPHGMAEAVLTLDNADGWLPIDFSEVSIGRRAYRSGDSEYLINGARARLRDVVELLAAGRLGANELVVVGQGTVDAALSLRPEERRQLFEEAAGVKNLQVRKNEALARLAKARDNLTRINDLVAELKPQVRRLAAQAQHQQEHDALRARARSMVLASHHRREQAARAALGEARRSAAAADAALEALRQRQSAARAAEAAAEDRYWASEAAARAAGERREATREALIRAEGRLEAVAARHADAVRAVEQAERDRVAVVDAASVDIPGDTAVGDLLAASRDAEAAWQSAISALAAADAELLGAEDALAAARRADAERLAEVARRAERLAAAQARRERIETELQTATTALEEAHARSASASQVAAARAESAAVARGRLDEARVAASHAEAAADAARRADAELAHRVAATRAELEASGAPADGERLGALLLERGWRALLDEIDAPEEAWPAIEALVGGELADALLWRDRADELEPAHARGAVRLLAAASDGEIEAQRADALAAVGAGRTLSDWLGATDLPLLFRRAVVAPDLAALRRGWRQLPIGWSAVTPAGDVADARGVLTIRGRGEAPGGATARRHRRARELGELLAAAERDLRAAQAASAAADAERDRARAELERAQAAYETADRDERRSRSDSETAAAGRARVEREIRSLRAELDAMTFDDLPHETGSDAQLDRLAARVAAARAARDERATVRDAARDAWRVARDAAQAAEARSVGARRAQALAEARLAQLDAAAPALAAEVERLSVERHGAEDAVLAATAADRDAATARAVADAERERLRRELLDIERGGATAAAQLAELERAAQQAAIEVSRRTELLTSLARERELALEGLREALGDPETEVEPEPVPDLEEEIASLDDDTLEAELRRVRRTLAQIGSVNPFAIEEHAELSSRLEELTSQDEDVRAAVGSTEELIARLDAEISQGFNAAFSAIGERFDEYCQLLFAGGSASLQMSDGVDGEAPGGIEIAVRPPGKRLQRLAMLSGGERALAGVALLFAMLTVNPVPFCILDEVDAALDEANIGRFAEALRRLSRSIDFVVITHNRATMEIADTIYGVTMTDAAVSRVLSLRLADIPVEAAV